MLLHLNRFLCLDVHLGKTAKFLFSINDRHRNQHLSSIEHDQLWHRLIHAAGIHLASYKSCIIEEKQASLGEREGPCICIEVEIRRLGKLLYIVLCARSIFLLWAHSKLGPRFFSLPLADAALFFQKPGKVGHQICPPRVRRFYFCRRLIVDVINCI